MIQPNPANMCMECLKSQVDITEGIDRECTLKFCSDCGKYNTVGEKFLPADPESPELLKICLNKIHGLDKVRLVDASWIWTEPHSRRLKIKLTIQKEVFQGAILQRQMIVTYIVGTQQCPDCRASFTPHTWHAVVQVRQHVEHRRTFLYLEQVILKRFSKMEFFAIREESEGIDFFFNTKSQAQKFVDFLRSMVPGKLNESTKLVSHDASNSTANQKTAFSYDIPPICKDDIIMLPPKTQAAVGGIGPLCLVTAVTNTFKIIDPQTGRSAYLNQQKYYASPFTALMSLKDAKEMQIVDVEYSYDSEGVADLCDCEVLNDNGEVVSCHSHLGKIVHPGDNVLAYDIVHSQHHASSLGIKKYRFPDVVLVKRIYESRKHRRDRPWKLERLITDPVNVEREEADLEEFMNNIEDDPELRKEVAVYRNDSVPYDPVSYGAPLPNLAEMISKM